MASKRAASPKAKKPNASSTRAKSKKAEKVVEPVTRGDAEEEEEGEEEDEFADLEESENENDEDLFGSEQGTSRSSVPGFANILNHGASLGLDDDTKAIWAAKKRNKSGGFQSMGLSQSILRGILRKGYKVPTPIQRRCIPLILESKDVVGMARTGSGKTAAFVVPMLEKLKTHSAKVGIRGIILSPSRELAFQTYKVVKEIGRFTGLRCVSLVGGESMEDHFAAMTNNPDIVIATPGRLMHLIIEMELSLSTVEYIVFDEADRLFEMGFETQLHEILHKLPSSRQTLLFSATLPKVLVDFARAGLNEPVLIRLDTDTKISTDLELGFFTMAASSKTSCLLYVLRELINVEKQLTIVFVATKHHVEYLQMLLSECGFQVASVYGALDPEARKNNVLRFRNGRARILLVTDVASRGIDIPLLDNVINYDFPARPKLFVHRVGRVARAGRLGKGFSFVAPDEVPYLLDLQLFLGRSLILGNSASTEADEAKTSVVVGSVPQALLSAVDEEINMLHSNKSDLLNLHGVVMNAYKMYNKTRPVAATESYTRAKTLMANPIAIHPWLADHIDENEESRLAFLQSIRSFRPADTIFEIGKHAKEGSKLMQKTRSIHKSKLKRELPQSTSVFDDDNDDNDDGEEHHKPTVAKKAIPQATEQQLESSFTNIISNKRKRTDADDIDRQPKKTFRDEENYISHVPKDIHADQGYSVQKGGSFIEQARHAVLDFTGEDADSFKKQKSALKWDAKKKKFIRQTVGADNKKRIRTESGALISASYKTNKYAEWRDKNKVALTQAGSIEAPQLIRRKDGRWVPKRTPTDIMSAREEAPAVDNPDTRRPEKKGKSRSPASSPAHKNNNKRKPKSELKSVEQIQKARRIKQRRQQHLQRRQQEKARKGSPKSGGGGGGAKRGGAGKKRSR